MIVVGIILLVVGIALLILGTIAEVQEWDCCLTAIGWFAGGLFVLGMAVLCIEPNEITPMDVYQGKTTLQYTVVDSVKVDSVVVWKRKEDGI